MSTPTYRAALFDMDGVIVDTARYHYLAWKKLAQSLGFDFTAADNERLKGVSRMRSLEILLEIGGLTLDADAKVRCAEQKNRDYLACIATLNETDLLPGARECLFTLRQRGIKLALGTASKNAPLIISRLNIADLFDTVVDGNRVTRAKPDPEVFLLAAHELGVAPAECVVFEDAEAGLQAARAAGMYPLGIGMAEVLPSAAEVIPGLHAFQPEKLFGAG